MPDSSKVVLLGQRRQEQFSWLENSSSVTPWVCERGRARPSGARRFKLAAAARVRRAAL